MSESWIPVEDDDIRRAMELRAQLEKFHDDCAVPLASMCGLPGTTYTTVPDAANRPKHDFESLSEALDMAHTLWVDYAEAVTVSALRNGRRAVLVRLPGPRQELSLKR